MDQARSKGRRTPWKAGNRQLKRGKEHKQKFCLAATKIQQGLSPEYATLKNTTSYFFGRYRLVKTGWKHGSLAKYCLIGGSAWCLCPKARSPFVQCVLFHVCAQYTSVRTLSPVPFHLFSIPFQSFHTYSKPCQERVLVWPAQNSLDSISLYLTVSRPGATDPCAKHQALAPSLPMSLPPKLMFVTVVLTFNASARACAQKRCQTKKCQIWELTRRSATLT